jgi:hypothetical protein
MHKILALAQNISGFSKYSGFPKYRRMFKLQAPKLCGIVKLLRHIIYDRNKADVEISAPDENYCAYQKYRRPSYAPIKKSGAQTLRLLTIWARQNLQLLTSSKSG